MVVGGEISNSVDFSFALFLPISLGCGGNRKADKKALFCSVLKLHWELVHKVLSRLDFYCLYLDPTPNPKAKEKCFLTTDKSSSVQNKLP